MECRHQDGEIVLTGNIYISVTQDESTIGSGGQTWSLSSERLQVSS
jgi:hypothetical protein